MRYQVNEIFYSLQGEGLYTGTPMIFIRLAGCNLQCPFCDTDFQACWTFSSQEVLDRVKLLNRDCKRICITGGEPTLQNLSNLMTMLLNNKYYVHLETNGTRNLSPPIPNWITVSPKSETLCKETLQQASELKFLYGPPYDDWSWLMKRVALQYDIPETTLLYLQPMDGPNIGENTKYAVEFCKAHPRFRLSLQTHKLLNIR